MSKLNFLILFFFGLIAFQEVRAENFNFEKDCPEGKCLPDLVKEAEELTKKARADKCLPSENATEAQVNAFYDGKEISEECFSLLQALKIANDKIILVQSILEGGPLLSGDLQCRTDGNVNPEIAPTLMQLAEHQDNQCTEEKAKKVSAQCNDDLMCALKSSSTNILGPLAKIVSLDSVFKNYLPKDCDAVADNCFSQLLLGFADAAWNFLVGVKDLAVMGWKALWGIESKTSDAQLGLAKASEEPSVFSALVNDFPGSMKKLWGGLTTLIKEWLKTDVFCEKWEGTPHFSKCLEPYTDFDCLSCKTMIRGGCSALGNVLAEIVPAFLTGGAVTVIKHGASAATKLAKGLKVSSKLRTAMKATKLDKAAKVASTLAKSGITKFKAIGTAYLNSVLHKSTMLALSKFKGLVDNGLARMVVAGGKRSLVLGGKGLGSTFKVVMFPLDNALTRKAFEKGMSLAEIPFKGRAAAMAGGVRAAELSSKSVAALREVDDIGAELALLEARLAGPRPINPTAQQAAALVEDARNFQKLRTEYLQAAASKRAPILDDVFTKSPDKIKIDDVINDLYPELRYDDELVKGLTRSKIAEAEADLLSRIKKVQDPKIREQLTMEFNNWRSRPSRAALKIDQRRFFHTGEILKNADLNPNDRFLEALRLTSKKSSDIPPEKLAQLRTGLLKAHEVGAERGAKVFSYTADEIREKARILKEAGYATDEVDVLMRSGLAGRGFREVIPAKGVAFQAAKQINAEELVAFRQLHQKNLDELVKAGKLSEDMIKPENILWAHNPSTDIRYIVIKDPNNMLDSYVFSLEKSRWNPFAKAEYHRLRDMPKGFGDLLRLSDGQAVKVVSRDAALKAKPQDVKLIQDSVKSTYKQHLDELIKVSDNPKFKEFLQINSNELERLLKTGNFTVSDLKPENFMILKPVGSKDEFYLLRSADSLESRVFIGNSSTDIRTLLRDSKTPVMIYENSNGNLVRISSNSLINQFEEIVPVLSKVEAENVVNTIRQKLTSTSIRNSSIDEFIQKFGPDLEFELRSGRLKFDDLSKIDFGVVDIDGTKKALVYLKRGENPDQLKYFVVDGSIPDSGNISFIASRIGDEIKLSNGKALKKWKFGNDHFFDQARNTREFYSTRIDDMIKKYSVTDRNGNYVFKDHVEFYSKHKESILKLVDDGENIALGFRNLARASTAEGEDIFFFLGSRLKDDSIVLTNSGPKKLKDVLKNNELLLNDGRVLSRRSPDQFFVNSTEDFIANNLLRESVQNSRMSLKQRLDIFKLKYVRAKNLPYDSASDSKILKSLEESLQYATDNGVQAFKYSPEDLRKLKIIFKSNGVADDYADYLIRSGLAARPPDNVLSIVNSAKSPYSSLDFELKRKALFTNLNGEIPTSLRSPASRVARLTKEEVVAIQDNFDSMYFIDYQHHADELLKVAKSEKGFSQITLSTKYNEGGKNPFTNFKNTMDWLRKENPPLNTTTMKKIHVKMMEGGIEDLRPDFMGISRSYDVYGNVSRGITREALESIQDNHYLSFLQTGTTTDGLITGKIWYPNVEVVSDKTLDLIRKSHPDIVDYIESRRRIQKALSAVEDDFVKLNTEGANLRNIIQRLESKVDDLKKRAPVKSNLDELETAQAELASYKLQLEKLPEQEKLRRAELIAKQDGLKLEYQTNVAQAKQRQQQLLDALTEEALNRFNSKRATLGTIDSPEKFDQYADMLAELQRDMVSIHPLGNGNGRTTRQFALYYPLMKEGFPPPRILDPNNDLYRPLSEWSKEIKEGIRNSQKLIDDLEYRTRLGLKVEDSPYLLTPKSPPETIELTYKLQGKKDALTQVEKVDPELFHHYRMRVINEDTALRDMVASGKQPTATWEAIDKKASELYKRDNIYFDHQKKGLERLGLGPVSKEFVEAYGRPMASDPLLYQRKMNQFFDDQVVWRGLASKNHVKSEEELINFFRQTNNHMASNSILGKRLSSAEDIRKAGLDDLEKYRKSLEVDGDQGIVRMAKDHSETGPMYGQSWGYSTSKDRKVGKAFAQGAMVVAPYGQHQKFQHLLKQRVLVGGRKAKTDVDLSRLRNLRGEFSYKYPRQQEVMGVGAMDPDAIQVVQTLDEAGKASKTYLRNPDRPYEVLVINGEVNPGDKIPQGLIEKVIDLRK